MIGIGMIVAAGLGAVSAATADDNGATGANDAQASLARQQAANSVEYQELWRNRYRPLEVGLVDATTAYGTPAYRNRLAGEYKASTNAAYSGADQQGFESLRARGVDPTSGNGQGIAGDIALSRAAGMAGADRQATQDAENNYFSKGMTVANLGRGLVTASGNASNSAQRGFGDVGSNANQMTANQAAFTAPFVNALGQGVGKYVDNNAGAWFGGGNQPITGAQANPNAYSNMSNVAAGYGAPNFNQGGEVESRGIAKRGKKRRLADGGVGEPGTTHSGAVVGPGDGTVDTVDAILANGEQVINAEAVKIIGRPFLDAINKVGLMRRYDREQRATA